jgi:hypothetical protein
MLVSLKELTGSKIKGLDEDLGGIKDVYFDDRHWTIRYIVPDTHPWLPLSEKVLISPIALISYYNKQQLLNVSLSKEAITELPKLGDHETVSREFERMYFDYFGYGYYWQGVEMWGEYSQPTYLFKRNMLSYDSVDKNQIEDNNSLRSANEILDYGIQETDGRKGHVQDYIWDTETWTLRYLVIDTRDWFPGGKKVLVSPCQLIDLSWQGNTIKCNMDIAHLKNCPEFKAQKLNDPEYQKQLQDNAS